MLRQLIEDLTRSFILKNKTLVAQVSTTALLIMFLIRSCTKPEKELSVRTLLHRVFNVIY